MEEVTLPYTIPFHTKWLVRLSFVGGLLIGLFGTYYFVYHYYLITGPICFFNVHIHHLYIGLIIATIMAGLIWRYYDMDNKTLLSLVLVFFLGFGFGMFLDDVLDHFVFIQDVFKFFCS